MNTLERKIENAAYSQVAHQTIRAGTNEAFDVARTSIFDAVDAAADTIRHEALGLLEVPAALYLVRSVTQRETAAVVDEATKRVVENVSSLIEAAAEQATEVYTAAALSEAQR